MGSFPESANDLKVFIVAEARRLGFDKVGFAAAEPLEGPASHLQTFLSEQRHGAMEWMARRQAERGNIKGYWPEAQTVVSLAMNYHTGPSSQGSDGPRWSNYAWGDDYHRLIKRRLKELLAAVLAEHPDVAGRVCVDTSPVMEKVWAQQAGLGWQGKHTNLISRDYGSWLFLGELLLDIPLAPDVPFEEDLCGSCTACLDACPTTALDVAYQLDAQHCISYLTIEHRGDFSPAQEEALSGWLYGCDICQEVCPWNEKFSQPSAEDAFQPRPFTTWTWERWSNLDEAEWDEILRGSAARRPGYQGLMRNIGASKQVDTREGSL